MKGTSGPWNEGGPLHRMRNGRASVWREDKVGLVTGGSGEGKGWVANHFQKEDCTITDNEVGGKDGLSARGRGRMAERRTGLG